MGCGQRKTLFFLLGHWDNSKMACKSLKLFILFVPVKYIFTGTLLGQNWDKYFYREMAWHAYRLGLPGLFFWRQCAKGFSCAQPRPADGIVQTSAHGVCRVVFPAGAAVVDTLATCWRVLHELAV